MMVSPPRRDLSIDLFGKRLNSPMFMCPIGLIGLCSPDFQGDVAAARASAATGVPFALSTFSQAPMEEVIKHAGSTPNFFQLYLPADRELASSFINRAETSGYSALLVTVDSWTLGFRPADLERGNFPQFRGFCMENYYSDNSFTKHLAKPPHDDQAAALAYYSTIFAHPFTWKDLLWIRSQTKLPIAVKGIQHADDARLAIDNGADVLYCTNHGGRQANSGISTLQLLPEAVKAAGSTPVLFDSGVRDATDAVIALALGATSVGIGRPYAYALSYGGAESLTHYLKSFLAEFDLTLAICGFKDIAALKGGRLRTGTYSQLIRTGDFWIGVTRRARTPSVRCPRGRLQPRIVLHRYVNPRRLPARCGLSRLPRASRSRSSRRYPQTRARGT